MIYHRFSMGQSELRKALVLNKTNQTCIKVFFAVSLLFGFVLSCLFLSLLALLLHLSCQTLSLLKWIIMLHIKMSKLRGISSQYLWKGIFCILFKMKYVVYSCQIIWSVKWKKCSKVLWSRKCVSLLTFFAYLCIFLVFQWNQLRLMLFDIEI